MRVKPYLLSREQFLGDPNGTNLATFEDFKYIIFEFEMDVADIERYYHIKEKDFARSTTSAGYDTMDAKDRGVWRKQHSYKETGQKGTFQKITNMARRTYPVHIMFYNQGSPEIVAFGDKPPKKLKYPLGRQLVLINNTKLVVDRHNPYWHGRFPVSCYQTMPMPHFGGGYSDVTPLIPIQNVVNILQNMIVTNAMVLGVPQWIVEDGVIDDADITNEPGAVMHARPGTIQRGGFQRMEPGTIGGEIYTILR